MTKNRSKAALAVIALFLFVAGCAAQTPATFHQKVSTGKFLYRDNCAACHGVGGAGNGNPPIIGASVAQIKHAINTVQMMANFLGDIPDNAALNRMSFAEQMHYLKVGINNRMYETPDKPAFSDSSIKYISLYLKDMAAIPPTPKRKGKRSGK